MKYILVTGGVISGVGKGVLASSIGTILKAGGIRVTSIKIDPYINIDAGTFSPYEHGEVYVLDDGGEVDLDLGNYERFLDVTLTRDNNITTGKIYQYVISKERRGDYLGKTVQVVPHITDAIQQWVEKVAKVPVDEDAREPDCCIIELGGTIGDIEGMPFVEAFRQFQFKVKKENFACVHVSLIPQPKTTGEQKTKPTQNSVRELRGLGLSPDLVFYMDRHPGEHGCLIHGDGSCGCRLEMDTVDTPYYMVADASFALRTWIQKSYPGVYVPYDHRIYNHRLSRAQVVVECASGILAQRAILGQYCISYKTYIAGQVVCRSVTPLEKAVKEKLSMFCHVAPEQVIGCHDVSSIYRVPLLLEEQKVVEFFADRLQLPLPKPKPRKYLMKWKELADKHDRLLKEVTIALVGKYTRLEDAYASVIKALQHAAMACNHKLNLKYVEATDLENTTLEEDPVRYHEAWQRLCSSSGVLIPGGFGTRGVEGMIKAAEWSRKTKKPMLGVCLGLQCAVVEFARNELGWKDAHSTEIDPNTTHPVVIEMPEHNPGNLGGTMRLGKRRTVFKTDNSICRTLYGDVDFIEERHRHRYEVNPNLVSHFEEKGMRFVGHDVDGERMEVLELDDHPYYVAVQYHPEYISRPMKPSPPYLGLLLGATGKLSAFLSRGCRASPNSKVSDSEYSDDDDISNEVMKILSLSRSGSNASFSHREGSAGNLLQSSAVQLASTKEIYSRPKSSESGLSLHLPTSTSSPRNQDVDSAASVTKFSTGSDVEEKE